MSQISWIEQQEANKLFRGADVGKLALHLLKISKTNRIVTEKGSKLLMACRMLNIRLGENYNWLSDVADMCEEYQLTIGEPRNSRTQFIDALKAELAIQAEKKKVGLVGL